MTDVVPYDPSEVVTADGAQPSFEQRVRKQYRDRCGNCGSDHKLRVKLVVPAEAGGLEIESNAILVCRACEMAADTVAPLVGTYGDRRIINFWVSRQTYDRMTNGMATSRGLRSMSSLVRYLMASYVEDAQRFDDLDKYQDAASSDVKVNVWVPIQQYEVFKVLVAEKNMTVTDAVKSLIGLFDAEVTEPKPGDVNV
jgi:hypothetical protein